MQRVRRLQTCLVLLAGAALVSSAVEARDLTVVGGGGSTQAAQRRVFYTPFTEQTKIPVLEDSWAGGLGILRTKVQSGHPNWDIVQVESDEVTLGCEEGIYEKLDWTMLGGRDKFFPQAVNDCGVGSVIYSVGLLYDGDKIKGSGPKSWVDFWDTNKWPGKRGLRRGPKLTLEIALLADGVAPKDLYKVLRTPEGVDRAFRKLDALKPDIVWWTAGAQPLQLVASGEVAMTAGYFSRLGFANHRDNKNFKAIWNQSLFQVDFWVILKGSPNKETAMKLVQFMTRPENQSKIPALAFQGVTNLQAAKQADPAVQADLPTFPANMAVAIPVDVEFWVENVEQLTKRYETWASK